VTGAGGQLGRDLVEAFGNHDVIAATHAELDVCDRDAVLQAVTGLQPDAVVHAGAWTDVDGCELDPDRAFGVNALGTRHVAEGCRLAGSWLCYVSTDYVFDGQAREPYREWDRVNPLSVYGRSKLGGEHEIGGRATLVRTSWVCGVHGSNFVKTMLRIGAERDELTVVDDQHGCPTFTPDLAEMIRRLVVGRMEGIFHVTNQGATTWYELARHVLEAAGLDAEKVRPVASSELDPPRPAPRPAYSVLDNAALRLQGLALLPDWHEPLERMVKELTT